MSKLNAAGSGLDFSTFLGGRDLDLGTGIAVNAAGEVYVTGYTTCESPGLNHDVVPVPNPPGLLPNFDCAPGSFPTTPGAPQPAMDGRYINFILSDSPTDMFVAKLSADGHSLLYGTFLGGPGFDRGFAIALRTRDELGRTVSTEAYITGRNGTNQRFPGTFPTTPGAFQTVYGGSGRDAAVTKLVG